MVRSFTTGAGRGTRAWLRTGIAFGATGSARGADFRTQHPTLRRGGLPAHVETGAVLLYAQRALRQRTPRNKLSLSCLVQTSPRGTSLTERNGALP